MISYRKKSSDPNVPTEYPDKAAAARNPGKDAKDRPGADLGGAKDRGGSEKMPNPRTDPAERPKATGRASGLSDPSGSRSLGESGDSGSASGVGRTKGSEARPIGKDSRRQGGRS